VLNKPLGVTTTALREKIKDPPHTVYDLLEALSIDTHNLGCVGRLDQDTAGVLIFTDDGKLNSKIRGIRSTMSKLYRLIVFTGSKLSSEQLDSLALPLDGETLPACVEVVRVPCKLCRARCCTSGRETQANPPTLHQSEASSACTDEDCVRPDYYFRSPHRRSSLSDPS
jgi:16S rRNA U516 pseudouridylate synthase RsuA-like enzyme